MRMHRLPVDGRTLADLAYGPPEAARAAERRVAPRLGRRMTLRELPRVVARNLATQFAYAAGKFSHYFPNEVHEAFRWGLADARREDPAGEGPKP